MDEGSQSPSPGAASSGEPELLRNIRWPDAVWIAAGVPALLVFSVGYIATLDGPISVIVWIVSVLVGIGMAFVYAELAGMFPAKSGGPPVFGAQAWKRYFKPIAPLDIWGYWFAWSPVISIGGLLMGDYIQSEWIPHETWDASWGPFHITLPFVLGLAIILGVLWINHFGIRESARIQFVLTICSLIPLALMILVPLFEGKIHLGYLSPFTIPGAHGWEWFKLFLAGLFVAGWSAYAFETAVVYTAEFRKPQRDTPAPYSSPEPSASSSTGSGPSSSTASWAGRRSRPTPPPPSSRSPSLSSARPAMCSSCSSSWRSC